MAHYKLAYIGFGNVAQELVRLFERKRSALKNTYGIVYSVTGIATGHHGCAVNDRGLGAEEAIRRVGAIWESREGSWDYHLA